MRYKYVGPIFRFGELHVVEWYGGLTEAKSKKQAVSFFQTRAKRFLGLVLATDVKVDPEKVVEAPRKEHKVYKPELKKQVKESSAFEEQLTFSCLIGNEKWK